MAKKVTTTTVTTTVEETPISEKKTYVALVLDASGSMASVRDDTIGGFNVNVEQIKKNAALGGRTYVSLFTFGEPPSSQPKVKLLNAAPETLEPLTDKTYIPSGGTPMLDAIGLALSSLQPYDVEGEDVAFLMTVLTDGQENQSREWSGPKLAALIEQLQAKGNWTITLIGANVDVKAIGRMTGIQQTVSYVSDSYGTQSAFKAQANASASYFANRTRGGMAGQSMNNLYAGEVVLDSFASASLGYKAEKDLQEAMERLQRQQKETAAAK